MFSFCSLVTSTFLSEVFQRHQTKKAHSSLFNCKYYVSSIITPLPKMFVNKVVILQLESVRHEQRHNPLAYMIHIIFYIQYWAYIIGRLSNTAVFGCFQLFCEKRDTVAVFWPIFLVIKAKQDQSSCCFPLIYRVNDFLTNFMRRLKSSDRLDRNENSMFRCPLGLLE